MYMYLDLHVLNTDGKCAIYGGELVLLMEVDSCVILSKASARMYMQTV